MKVQLYPKSTKWRIKVTRSLTTDVIAHGHITTTEQRAKEIKRHVEKMITLAKKGDLSSRRRAASFLRKVKIKNKNDISVLAYLFTDLAERYKDRNGGYTRIIKVPNRKGDNSKMALLELV